ncbi:MAG: EAL domain-containing protein [Gammaproteobacteria bacterium]|nr:EAL domain-containing protein [Gammaproteobacteria bacterium]
MSETINARGERPLALVVDDDRMFRVTARAALEQAGFDVDEAENGRIALAKFGEQYPDIVLLDIVMPDMDGYATCAAFRELPFGTHVPIIMLTGLDDEESIKRAYEAGATDFITKPVNYLILTHRMNYVLRTSRYLVHFDELTGLPNRTVFLDHLRHVVASGRRNQRPLAVLFLDVDNFKRFNETLGYGEADALLRRVAKRLHKAVRTTDYVSRDAGVPLALHLTPNREYAVARLGGDQFVVALVDFCNVDDIAVAVRRITENLAKPYDVDGNQLHITTSIGISVYPLDGDDPDDLLKYAEVSMNHAKQNGGNRYRFYTEDLDTRTQRRFSVETQLRKSLETEELEIHYQPILDVQSNEIEGMEALVRWSHPELGIVSPSEFIGIAEETGLILDLGEWVFRSACKHTVECHRRGLSELIVSINLSAAQFIRKEFASLISEILDEEGLDPCFVNLELTEGLLMDDTASSITAVAELKALGVGITIDDFGTGYSSLAYLKRFPLNGLKIDQSFMPDLFAGTNDGAIVSAIIGLGRSLGLKVVAEGIESQAQFDFLRALGCDRVQGYLISQALPLEKFAQWAASWRGEYTAASPAAESNSAKAKLGLVAQS